MTQVERADHFHALHQGEAPFIVPNPWDVGSARMLEQKGFKALATTSAGYVFSTGRQEGSLTRAEVLQHCSELIGAVNIPVSADLEDGYADDLPGVAETYKLAGQAGLVGASIEDARIALEDPLYGFEQAVERVQAAVEGARSLPFKFTLTARAENFLYGAPDIADTIRRLQAYQDAGADVLYAPGLTRLEDIAAVVSSVDLPVNVVVGLKDTQFTVDDLARVGVRRISIGSALFRRAFGIAMDAADEMLERGTFSFAASAKPFSDINRIFEP